MRPMAEREALARVTVGNLVLAAVYACVAQLSFVFELSPENIRVMVPAGGIALAAVTLFGSRLAFGVFLGSFANALLTYGGASPTTTATVATAIAAGAALQALLGSQLLHRFVGTLPPADVRHIARATAMLALASAVMPVIRVPTLAWAGWLLPSQIWNAMWVAWVGTYIGILCVGPALIVLIERQRGRMGEEPFAWPITSDCSPSLCCPSPWGGGRASRSSRLACAPMQPRSPNTSKER